MTRLSSFLAPALVVALSGATSCTEAAASTLEARPVVDSTFWQQWGDGKAELAGYRLTRPRYGTLRTGTAVAIFVTEPWSVSAQVKADPGKHPDSDVMQVLKLNFVESFQTGVYDYDMMTSAFVGLASAPGRGVGDVTKVTFSAQEWCGSAHHEVSVDAKGGHELVRSYFDGESGARDLALPPGTFFEDQALHWARGLAAPVLSPGQSLEVPFIPALSRARLLHTPLAVERATLRREPNRAVTVPAGSFDAAVLSLQAGSRQVRYLVEATGARRLLRVESNDGTVLELLGASRLPYWELNGPGMEKHLAALGLPPPR